MRILLIFICFFALLTATSMAEDLETVTTDIKDNPVQWPSHSENLAGTDVCSLLGGVWYNLQGKKVCLRSAGCSDDCSDDPSCQCLSPVGLCVCHERLGCTVSITSPASNSVVNADTTINWDVRNGNSCTVLKDGVFISAPGGHSFRLGAFAPTAGSSSVFSVRCFDPASTICEASLTLFGPSPSATSRNKPKACQIRFLSPLNGSLDIEAGTVITWDMDTASSCTLKRDSTMVGTITTGSYTLASAPATDGTVFSLTCRDGSGNVCGSASLTLFGPQDTCTVSITSPVDGSTAGPGSLLSWNAGGHYKNFTVQKDGVSIQSGLTGTSIPLGSHLPEPDSSSVYAVIAYTRAGKECARDTITLKGKKTTTQCDCQLSVTGQSVRFNFKESRRTP